MIINKKTKLVLILVLGMIFILPFFSVGYFNSNHLNNELENETLTNMKLMGAGYWKLNETIFIDGSATGMGAHNWSWVKSQDWFGGGNGTWSNPYIMENITIDAQGVGSCIEIRNTDVYFIIRNCTAINSEYSGSSNFAGIEFINVNNSKLIKNNCSYNPDLGIKLQNCNNNSLIGNIVMNNLRGTILYNSLNNSVSANIMNNNTGYGLSIRGGSHYNNISKNIINNQYRGLEMDGSHNNYINENTIYNNRERGFFMNRAHYSKIYENNISNNGEIGLLIAQNINITVKGNNIENNKIYGLEIDCNIPNPAENNLIYLNIFNNPDGNNAFDEQYSINTQWDNGTIGNYWHDYDGTDVDDDGIGDTPYNNIKGVGGEDRFPIWYDGPTIIVNSPKPNDLFGEKAPNIDVQISDPKLHKMWYTLKNTGVNITFTYNDTINQNLWEQFENGSVTIEFYANDTFGNLGYHEVSVRKDTLEPIIIIDKPLSGEVFLDVPPFFNISIDESHLNSTWYTIDNGKTNTTFSGSYGKIDEDLWILAPKGPIVIRFYANDSVGHIGYQDIVVIKETYLFMLYIELIEHIFTMEEFNITFYVFNETDQGISFATIEIWWNGVNVSKSVENLGNGLYFVSLDPITVAPGENPILLNMTIKADGYQDMYFETYIAVDPDTLQKGDRKPSEEFILPIILTVSVLSSVAIIGVASMYWLRMRKK